jgi:hypothetical protein
VILRSNGSLGEAKRAKGVEKEEEEEKLQCLPHNLRFT